MLLRVAIAYSFSCAVQSTIIGVYPSHVSPSHVSVFIHCIAGGNLDAPFRGIMDKVAMIDGSSFLLLCLWACISILVYTQESNC